jgi:hypothetical protein
VKWSLGQTGHAEATWSRLPIRIGWQSLSTGGVHPAVKDEKIEELGYLGQTGGRLKMTSPKKRRFSKV